MALAAGSGHDDCPAAPMMAALAINPSPPLLARPDAAGTRSSTALRVLVVDDNVDAAEALCTVLASMGCETAVAHDGTRGLALAEAFHPHLALIDLEMPDMSGRGVARQLRARQAGSGTRLVCLTGRGHPEDRRLCIEAGFDDFFTKPMLPLSLLEVVAAATLAPGRR